MRWLLALSIFIFLSSAARAQEPSTTKKETPPAEPTGRAFSFYIENDTRRLGGPGSDAAYSNGFKFSYTFAETKVPHWLPSVMGWSDLIKKSVHQTHTDYSVSLAQQIYTPNNTGTSELIPNDRPYAAWLYVGFNAEFSSPSESHNVELDLGTIGPNALGKTVQNGFHRIIGIAEPQGWSHQLRNEPTLEISYQHKFRMAEIKRREQTIFDAIPYYGLAVGNVLDSVYVGGLLRGGFNLPDDFGPSRPSALGGDAYVNPSMNYEDVKTLSVYGFIGGRVNGVARNIFLDGNTFGDAGPHVTRNWVTLENEFGFGAQLHHWSAVWRFVTRSPEFKEKREINSFASISITYSMSSP